MGSTLVNIGTEARGGTAPVHQALSVGCLGEEPYVLCLSTDGLGRHGLVETLSLCCYARAAEAHIGGMRHRKQSAIESLFQGQSTEDSRR
jgi:hypothetical protein